MPSGIRCCVWVRSVVFFASTSSMLLDHAVAQRIYWSDDQGIRSANADGTDIRTLVSAATRGQDTVHLTLDPLYGYIYWANSGCGGWCPLTPGLIRRASLDGIGVQTLVWDYVFAINGLAIDFASRRMYWGGQVLGDFIYDAAIWGGNIDGSEMQRLLGGSEAGWPSAFAYDPVTRTLYWAGYSFIKRIPANDPMQISTIVLAERYVGDVVLEDRERLLYWSDDGAIKRADLDGSGVEVVITPENSYPRSIAVDPFGGKVYWTTRGEYGADAIWRANLDGSGEEEVLPARYIWTLAVDPRTPGDFNMDSRIDSQDFASLVKCMSGPGHPSVNPPCAFFDSQSHDRDVDLADLAEFQTVLTAPG